MSKGIWVVLGVFMASQAAVANNNSMIVGGVEAAPQEFPSIVSLQSGSWGHFCGGSLIRKNWVITAAHCVKGSGAAAKLKVVVGLHKQKDFAGTETFGAKRVIVHPDYGKKTDNGFDAALIELDGESKFAPIKLNADRITDLPDDEALAQMSTTAGWGTTKEGGSVSPVLMKVDVPLVSYKNCETAYPKNIDDSMICAGYEKGGKDSCQGDSGGPLYVKDANSATGELLLAGLVSWGRGCARAKYYGVYAEVSGLVSWVKSQVDVPALR
jgi:trypsin